MLMCSPIRPTLTPFEGAIFMRTIGAYVRARIDQDTKERAAEALEAMGLSLSLIHI